MEEGGALALELANVGGVFVLLIVGCVAALFVSFCEMLCDVHRRTRELKVGLVGRWSLFRPSSLPDPVPITSVILSSFRNATRLTHEPGGLFGTFVYSGTFVIRSHSDLSACP